MYYCSGNRVAAGNPDCDYPLTGSGCCVSSYMERNCCCSLTGITIRKRYPACCRRNSPGAPGVGKDQEREISARHGDFGFRRPSTTTGVCIHKAKHQRAYKHGKNPKRRTYRAKLVENNKSPRKKASPHEHSPSGKPQQAKRFASSSGMSKGSTAHRRPGALFAKATIPPCPSMPPLSIFREACLT